MSQNPEIYSTPTSGLIDFVIAKNNYNHSQEKFQAQNQDEMTKAFVDFCKDAMQGYFKRLTDKPIVMDKSREWGINYGLLEMLQKNQR